MRRALFVPSVLVLVLACEPSTASTTPDPAGGADGTESVAEAALSALEPPSVDLGPEDPDLDPLIPVEAVEYDLPSDARRILRGRSGSGRKLPQQRGKAGRLMVAIDTPYQLFARDSTYLHVAAWRTNGRPASGASVFVGKREVGRTDSTGTLVFRYETATRDGEDEYGGSVDAISVVDSSDRCGEVEFNPYARTASFASDNLFVYTDRGVYRPGETVRVRGIGWRLTDDYAPLKDASIEIQLRDADGHTVAGGIPKTDEFGVVELELPLAATSEEGLYELRVAYGQERATARLQIRDFKAPAITIEHTLGRFVTRDADSLAFDVSLALITGEPVVDARLELRTTTRKGTVLFEREFDLSGPGPHAIALTPAELELVQDGASEDDYVIVGMVVTDSDGRRDELRRELRVTSTPYVAVVELDKDQYGTGEVVSAALRVSDLDRVPARDTEVRVELVAGSGAVVTQTAKTDGKGTATVEFAMPEGGGRVDLYMPKVSAAVASAPLPWVAERAMQSRVDALVIAERETAKLVVRFPSGYRPADAWVHVDVVDTSGALVNATLLAVSKEQGQWVARGEFRAPTWGSMLLTCFALGQLDGEQPGPGEYGLLTEGQNLVVHPDKQLDITLQGFPSSARPGEDLDIHAKVVDAQGRPVDAAVGVSLVDAAVVDLKDPLEITPMDRFYNPELRTMSTTGSKILTWPVVSRNWGDNQMDVALPPFAYLDGGAVNHCWSSGGRDGDEGYAYGMGSGGAMGMGSSGLVGKGSGGGVAKPSSSSSSGEMADLDAVLDPSDAAESPEPRPGPQPAAPRATITVRTRLPEVSLWTPNARARAGRVEVRTQLPDSIGLQELIMVASDARGGVGVRRERVRVSQPVHVNVDLPARLIAGERLELPVFVTNSTASAHEFTVELTGLGPSQTSKLRVPSQRRGAVSLAVAPSSPGEAKVAARAVGGSHDDTLVRTVAIDGRGVPVPQTQRGVLTGGPNATPLVFDLDLAAAGNDARVRVRFPTITSAFAALDRLDQTLRDDPDALAVDLVTAAVVLQWAQARKLVGPEIDALRQRALSGVAMLRLIQSSSGAFGYWRNGKPSPYVTGWALDALLEARAAGLPDASDSIAAAAGYLVTSFAADGLVTVADIGWWEGSSEAVRLGLSAELYAVLARIPDAEQHDRVRKLLTKLDRRLLDELDAGLREPLAAARAIEGLVTRNKLSEVRARELLLGLISARDQAHWEPSWFHAYAGRLEASAVLVEVMTKVDAHGFAVEIRDALGWILSTRESWGMWHNERGSAAALRAIAAVQAPSEDQVATVEIWLDGQRLRAVTIDPADPFMSSLELAQLDLGHNLGPGKHRLELRYDGKLAPTVEVETRSWVTGTAGKSGKSGAKVTAKAGPAGAQRRLAVQSIAKLGVGGQAAMRVEFSSPSKPNQAGGTLVVAASNLVEVDLVALAAWVGPGRALRSARLVDGRVELELSPTATTVEFELPLTAIRRGTGHAPTIAWLPGTGHGDAEPVLVDPGALEVH